MEWQTVYGSDPRDGAKVIHKWGADSAVQPLTITLTGPAACGKSHAARLLMSVLPDAGFANVVIVEKQPWPMLGMEPNG